LAAAAARTTTTDRAAVRPAAAVRPRRLGQELAEHRRGRETIIDPCHRPPPVVEGAANDLVMRFQLGGCPTKIALDGALIEYSYQGGQVSSSFADHGAYGVSVTNVDAIGGEVLTLEHDYFAGTTFLSYDDSMGNLIGVSGFFDPKPQQAGSSDPDPIPLTALVELDALGRVTLISETIGDGYTRGVEYIY
jgi:hypothetical protein